MSHRAFKGTALALAAGLLSVSFSFDAAADQADGTSISEAQARHAAESFMRRQGFTRTGYSQRTARIGKARFVDGAWEVEIRFGGNIPDKSGIVIVDASTGKVSRAE